VRSVPVKVVAFAHTSSDVGAEVERKIYGLGFVGLVVVRRVVPGLVPLVIGQVNAVVYC
jgi:hypothetical protein